jgi:hypothetical protein
MPKTPEEIAAEAKAAAEKAIADKAALDAANGFPSETRVEDMTAPQQAAYWRNQSKVQQSKVESLSDYAKLKADSEELARVKAENATEQEKLVEQARLEGENTGAERYLTDAVTGRFQALTGKTDEEVATAFAHVDPKSFLDDKGAIVADRLKAFADIFGKSAGSKQEDPVAAALARQRAAGGGSGSSISEKRKETRDSLSKTKTTA